MQSIQSWSDLRAYGIDVLTGEACGLVYRVLCDVTEKGLRVLQKLWSIPNLQLAESWNCGSKEEPNVGSIMLTSEMIVPIGVFALLENGCSDVWLMKDGLLIGFDGDPHDERRRAELRAECIRCFAYRGTAGDRNVHVMSGRSQ